MLERVDEKILDGWKHQMPYIDFKIPLLKDYVMNNIRLTAYHEAGHAAAYAFFGYNGFKGISIIPTSKYTGLFTQRRSYFHLNDWYHERLKWIYARNEIIELLAGREAEIKAGNSCMEPLLDEIDKLEKSSPSFNLEEVLRFGTDEGKALALAKAIQTKGWSTDRIILTCEEWTKELLDIPLVWKTVENIAERLIEVGEITDLDEYDSLISPVLYKQCYYPKWKRRSEP